MKKEIEENALKVVQERNNSAKDFNVQHVFEDFFDGNLVTVQFKVEREGQPDLVLENYIYYDGKNSHHYRFQHEFLHDISKRQKKNNLKELAEIFGVSGSIAMILTLAIGYLAIKQIPIPDILSNGLTVIIGFYFGAQVLKNKV
ncbi:hypothetical protein [Shewanella holmiensis]|uniref:Uncharacterized protein n=1 Tax=Shewanella holmiensis TaxID=2952222 RepID=A0A9X3AQH4_9GAMM|nr:hypothetical protein [Shewanella holmiensis]MCT7943037.1 hypothetical protein [Shewanella holmiensis]